MVPISSWCLLYTNIIVRNPLLQSLFLSPSHRNIKPQFLSFSLSSSFLHCSLCVLAFPRLHHCSVIVPFSSLLHHRANLESLCPGGASMDIVSLNIHLWYMWETTKVPKPLWMFLFSPHSFFLMISFLTLQWVFSICYVCFQIFAIIILFVF